MCQIFKWWIYLKLGFVPLYFFPAFNAIFCVTICFLFVPRSFVVSNKHSNNNTQYCGKMRIKLDKRVANAAHRRWNQYRLVLPIPFTDLKKRTDGQTERNILINYVPFVCMIDDRFI